MPRTTQCTNCGVVLNLPDEVVGKKLKCPKCGTKFQADHPSGKGSSIILGVPVAGPASSEEIPKRRSSPSLPPTGKRPDSSQTIPPNRSEDGLPVAAGDLRETFDLPMMREAAVPSATKPAADALALFEETRPSTRRPSAAEARSKARRCPNCGGVVPVGMSICSSCGLDLETGMRVGLEDDLTPPPPPPPSGPPLSIAIIGGICLVGSIAATVVPMARWLVWHEDGWQWFIPVGAFAIFSSVHFLRGKSAKLLLVALTLGVLIDVLALIALPVYMANAEATVIEVAPGNEDPNSAGEIIQSPAERLREHQQQITTGILALIAYAGLTAFLCSPPVTRFIKEH
jgi:predicted  nucleic acid-binding Zn-ribbon protein